MRTLRHGHGQRLRWDATTVLLQLLHRYGGVLLKVESAVLHRRLDLEVPSLRPQRSDQRLRRLVGRQKVVVGDCQEKEETVLDLARQLLWGVGCFEGRRLQPRELVPYVDAGFLPQLPRRTGLGGLQELRLGVAATTCLGCGLELKVVDVSPGQLKVRPLLLLAGAVQQHQAAALVNDEDESAVVDVAIVDGAGHFSII